MISIGQKYSLLCLLFLYGHHVSFNSHVHCVSLNFSLHDFQQCPGGFWLAKFGQDPSVSKSKPVTC